MSLHRLLMLTILLLQVAGCAAKKEDIDKIEQRQNEQMIRMGM